MIIIEIDILRKKINEIDQEIFELILKRKSLVKKVGKVKNEKNAPIYVPEREREIFYNLAQQNNLTIDDVSPIFTEIISFCRIAEKKLNVAINTEINCSLLALNRLLGRQVNTTYFSNLSEVVSSGLNYILTTLSDETLKYLITNNWKIINRIEVEAKEFYLFTNFKLSYSHNVDFLIFKDNKIEKLKNKEEVDIDKLIGTIPKK